MNFDTRNEMIQIVPKQGVYCEIGVLDGNFSKHLYDTLQPSNLVLIDLFQGWCGSGDQDGNNFKNYNLDTCYETLKTQYENKPVILLKGDSSTLLSRFDDNTFDMIYIDGDHGYEGCKKDLEVAYKKCKSGGYIMGHDYEMNMKKARTHYHFGVQQAVDEFCANYNQEIAYKALDGCVSYGLLLKK